MRFLRPASRALSHLLRHDPVCHTTPTSVFSRHSPFASLSRAFDDPFFASPFSAPFYTVYEVRNPDNNTSSNNHDSNKAEQQHNKKHEEAKAAEPQQQQQSQQQQRSNDNRLTQHSGGGRHSGRWLDRQQHNRRHRHTHHPLSLFSPFDSLFATSPFFASHVHQPLEISVDLYSTPSAYQINAAIPGVRKQDIKLTVEDGVLTIEAERREERGGRPAKAATATSALASAPSTTPTTSANPSTTTATAPAADATTSSEQKTVEVEVKADSIDGKPAASQTAETDGQQQQQQPVSAEGAEGEQDDVAVHHVESYYGRVQRSLALPDDVDVDGLTARYEDGVLKIELPRVEERKQQVKQISIN